MFVKFLLTVAVIAFIWFGFKHLQRLTEIREQSRRPRPGDGPGGTRPPAGPVQDLVTCPVCGTWQVAANARACDRAACPYGRRRRTPAP
jgi:hypothetical protein